MTAREAQTTEQCTYRHHDRVNDETHHCETEPTKKVLFNDGRQFTYCELHAAKAQLAFGRLSTRVFDL